MNQVAKGQWFTLPSGKVAEVCSLKVVRMPRQDGDAGPQFSTEVALRFLDLDGAMAPGEFTLALSFIAKHCKRVPVAPPILI